MAVIEGTTRTYKLARAVYDFGTDGGAVGTITLRSTPTDMAGNTVPAGAVVLGGYIDVSVAVASATGTVALTLESAGDIFAAVSPTATLTVGRKSIVPAFTGASTIKTTVARSVAMTVATAAVTAGQFTVTLFYV
jgi:hypothetical protein